MSIRCRLVCPCSSGMGGGGGGSKSFSQLKPSTPFSRRNSWGGGGSQSGGLFSILGIAFVLFVATTYLVFSLDMIMVNEELETPTLIPRRRADNVDTAHLRPNPPAFGENGNNDGDDESEKAHRAKEVALVADGELVATDADDATTTTTTTSHELPDEVQFIGAALEGQRGSGGVSANANTIEGMDDPPIPNPDDEDDDVEAIVLATSKRIIPSDVSQADPESAAASSSVLATDAAGISHFSPDWKKIHPCKYGRSEKTATLAIGTWIWRHRRGAVTHDEYVKTPSDTRIRHLKTALRMVSDEVQDWKSLAVTAALAGYTVCKIELAESMVLAWQPRVRGDALIFTRHDVFLWANATTTATTATTNLIVEVPHPQFDHTLNQGLYVFSETNAKALILSESHRCSRSLSNKCTGNDGESIRSMCPGRTMYHNSDVAHSTFTVFHAAHEQLAADNPDAVFASLHATKAEEFVVSDGTSGKPSETLATFAATLAVNLPEETVGLCNDLPPALPPNLKSVPEEHRHLCGSTNVQGRHLNGAKDACTAKVSRSGRELTSSGRFLHIEQPVSLVLPASESRGSSSSSSASSSSSRPVMSKPLSDALVVAALNRRIRHHQDAAADVVHTRALVGGDDENDERV